MLNEPSLYGIFKRIQLIQFIHDISLNFHKYFTGSQNKNAKCVYTWTNPLKKMLLVTVIATEEKKRVQIALQKFRISGL